MLGKASKSENLLKNRSAVWCCGFFARNGGGADVVGGCGLGNVADCGYCGREAAEHFFNFYGFCSTFGTARAGFGVDGRTFLKFLWILFYFWDRANRIWSRR